MKVLLINGSPRPKGCTYTALCEIAKELERLEIKGLQTLSCFRGYFAGDINVCKPLFVLFEGKYQLL